MKPRIKLAVVVSDIHAGSTVGLLPPNFTTHTGNDYAQNPLQRWLWECWMKANGFVSEVCGRDPFALILNGDLVEGVHHGTKEIISPETKDHVEAAAAILEPLAGKAAKVFLTKGTETHVNNHEMTLGVILGAERNPESHEDPKKQLRVFDRLTLDINGVRCAWSHHIGTSVRTYTEATQFSIAINEEQIEAARNGEPLPRVIGRSHRHRFGFFQNHHAMCLVSAPWQGLTRFGHKVVTAAKPHPGLYILDWRGKAGGELPHVHEVTYEAPQSKAIAI